MTSDTLHDLDPSFQLQPSHLAQLQHIADTDEFLHEDDAQSQALPPSSASSLGSGAYDWPVLKDAIKFRIRACLQENFSAEKPLDVHPAAKLIPYIKPGSDYSATWAQANSGLLVRDALNPESNPESSAAGAEGASSQASESETAAVQPNGSASASPNEAMYAYQRDWAEHNPSGSDPSIHPPYVSAADAQNFYPSKRPTVPTTVAPLTADEIAEQTRILYAMLDDFDVQPPFTIQRLCELVVAPTTHYNSGSKWIGALKRCLSVTATRDAFPISPVQAPVGIGGVNGAHEEGSQSDLSEVDMDRMDGLPPSASAGRSRSSSVGSNANSEPLFSPIPFVVRDENGQLTHGGAHDVQQQQSQEAEASGMMEPIPDLELGGADRTQSMDTLPREVVDVAPHAATPEPGVAQSTPKDTQQNEIDAAQNSDEPMEESESSLPASTATAANAAAATSGADASGSVAAAVEASTSTSTSSIPSPSAPVSTTSSAAASEPLGVPDGQVDEIDNPAQTVNALTSTTTSNTSATATTGSAAAVAADGTSTSADAEAQGNADPTAAAGQDSDSDGDSSRSSKRRKSVASIHDARD